MTACVDFLDLKLAGGPQRRNDYSGIFVQIFTKRGEIITCFENFENLKNIFNIITVASLRHHLTVLELLCAELFLFVLWELNLAYRLDFKLLIKQLICCPTSLVCKRKQDLRTFSKLRKPTKSNILHL